MCYISDEFGCRLSALQVRSVTYERLIGWKGRKMVPLLLGGPAGMEKVIQMLGAPDFLV